MDKDQIVILEQFINLNRKRLQNTKNETSIKNQVLFIALLSSLIGNKKLFKKNKEVVDFLERKFDIVLPKYVQKSRPLIFGKVINHYLHKDNVECSYKEELNLLYKYMIDVINNQNDDNSWSDIIRNIKM